MKSVLRYRNCGRFGRASVAARKGARPGVCSPPLTGSSIARGAAMRILSLLLAGALSTSSVLAQQPEPRPIRDAADKAAAAMGSQPRVETGRGTLFWPGLVIGVAGVTTAILGTTVYRVEDNSTGNAPPGAFQACVAQKRDPVYATSNCDTLKAKNLKLLWSGVALGAAGAVMMMSSAGLGAELGPGGVRLFRR